jgi:hypothetical protein
MLILSISPLFSQEDMDLAIYQAIKANDVALLSPYIPTPSDLDVLFKQGSVSDSASTLTAESIKRQHADRLKYLHDKWRESKIPDENNAIRRFSLQNVNGPWAESKESVSGELVPLLSRFDVGTGERRCSFVYRLTNRNGKRTLLIPVSLNVFPDEDWFYLIRWTKNIGDDAKQDAKAFSLLMSKRIDLLEKAMPSIGSGPTDSVRDLKSANGKTLRLSLDGAVVVRAEIIAAEQR